MLVVLCDIVEPLGWHPPAAGDVLQERPNLLRAFRPAEGQQQGGVEFHYNSWVLAPPSA